MNNRLMILGTNEYQNPLILRAKELGYETHVFGWPVGEIGEKQPMSTIRSILWTMIFYGPNAKSSNHVASLLFVPNWLCIQ